MYLQHEALTTLDVHVDKIILRVKEMLLSEVLFLESKDGQECRDNTKNCAPCHLPIERSIHPKMAVGSRGFGCFVCGETKDATTMLSCDQCQRD